MTQTDTLKGIITRYKKLQEQADAWFASAVKKFPAEIACTSGCSACCRGFFDITLLEAYLLRQGFECLPESVRQKVLCKAEARIRDLQVRWPDFAPPFILNTMPDEEWVDMPEEDMTPCPLLDDQGRCLVYASRPMICRLHGLPHIDRSGESFSDEWCTLNFTSRSPLNEPELRWDFRALFEQEAALFREFTQELLGQRLFELDTFIPCALVIDFDQLGTDIRPFLDKLPNYGYSS